MRVIEGKLPRKLESKVDPKNIPGSRPIEAKTYSALVEHAAQIAYINKDYLLFYRGQTIDYVNKAGSSTFYPSIYRGEYLTQREVDYRFDILKRTCKLLSDGFEERKIQGASELKRKKYIQWSVLQHYEVCATPLLDFTQSLRVACSFALLDKGNKYGYIYVFGLPYVTNRISINSEHDLVNVRLLSICPPEALRPYYQEGYLAGTEDIENEYDNKSELDFKNRLIAKFKIPNTSSFWGRSFSPIPRKALYPDEDKVLAVCRELRIEADRELQPGDIGLFLQKWSVLEANIIKLADLTGQTGTVRSAIFRLKKHNQIEHRLLNDLDRLRRFRNTLVHTPNKVKANTVSDYLFLLDDIEKQLT